MRLDAKRLGALCLIITAAAWGRLAWTSFTQASPPWEIDFFGPDGAAVDRGDVHCHGAMILRGDEGWQVCDHRPAPDVAREHLTRFHLPTRRARLLTSPPGAHVRGLVAAAPHPEGGLIAADDAHLLRITDEAVEISAALPRASTLCLRHVEGAVEIASFERDGAPAIYRWASGEMRPQRGAAPSPEVGRGIKGVGCRWSPSGWRFIWATWPIRAEGREIEVSLLEGAMQGAPSLINDVTLGIYTDESDAPPYWGRRDDEGEISLDRRLLDLAPGYGVTRRWGPGLPLVWRAGRWGRPETPPEASLILRGQDYVVTDEGLIPLLTLEQPPHAQTPTGWVKVLRDADRDIQLQRLDEGFAPVGSPSPPLADSFWMTPGFKMLPRSSGGYWLMGSLGEIVVAVDEDLQRLDALSFVERLSRLMRSDRPKRNSDFYYGWGWLHRIAFWWVLLGALVCVIPLWRRRWLWAGSGLYLLGAAISAYSFWRMSGIFW